VIGGGDGGAITELAKYQDFKSLTLCEIDREVIEVSREHFPAISAGLDDPRVVLRTGDAAVFIEGSIEKWDLILVDSTDPVGQGKALFEKKFFRNIKERLNEGGVAIFQTESPLFMEEVFTRAVKNLKEVFGESNATPYLATVPSYPGGLWSFTFCSNGISPIGNDFGPVPSEIGKELGYYDPDVARCAFALPPFIRRMLGESSHGGPR
jgi:spermidine synthase